MLIFFRYCLDFTEILTWISDCEGIIRNTEEHCFTGTKRIELSQGGYVLSKDTFLTQQCQSHWGMQKYNLKLK